MTDIPMCESAAPLSPRPPMLGTHRARGRAVDSAKEAALLWWLRWRLQRQFLLSMRPWRAVCHPLPAARIDREESSSIWRRSIFASSSSYPIAVICPLTAVSRLPNSVSVMCVCVRFALWEVQRDQRAAARRRKASPADLGSRGNTHSPLKRAASSPAAPCGGSDLVSESPRRAPARDAWWTRSAALAGSSGGGAGASGGCVPRP